MDPEEYNKTLEILKAAREDDFQKLKLILTNSVTNVVDWNYMTRYGTPLHVTAYFGQPQMVKALLAQGADVNKKNGEGDTPLHKAAHTARADVVAMLVKEPGIDLVSENKEGLTAMDVAKSREVAALIENAQATVAEDLGRQMLEAAKAGDTARVLELLGKGTARLVNFSSLKDQATGNTLLHFAAKSGNKEFIIRLQQLGLDPNALNNAKQAPLQLATDESAKQLLKNFKAPEAAPSQTQSQANPTISGALERWTNYATGWKKRYFTVENGMLFYYNSAQEVLEGSRGSIRLHGATIMAKKSDQRVFLVRGKNSTTYHLRAENEFLRKKWLDVLSAASRIKPSKPDLLKIQDMPFESSSDLLSTVRGTFAEADENREPHYAESLDVSMDTLKWHKQSMEKLLASISTEMNHPELARYSQTFSSSSSILLETVTNLLKTAEDRVAFWKKKFEEEKRVRANLEESLRNLAVEKDEMEQEVLRGTENLESPLGRQRKTSHHDEDVFFDAVDDGKFQDFYDFTSTLSRSSTPHQNESTSAVAKAQQQVVRRRTLKTPMLDRSEVSLWSVIKEFVGKDLSKIAVPVYFNEPLSFLQKFSEDMEYCHLLNYAVAAPTSMERLLWVTAFAFSPYSSTTRIAKPFNPILGESFEMDRPDLGFRSIAEQVSHHPPISACHCEADDYIYWAEAHIKNRFLGNTLEVIPHGIFHVLLRKTEEHFYWNRVRTSANNLIIGSVWVDNYGEMTVTNAKTGEYCTITFKPKGWWGKGYGEVEGNVFDANKQPVYRIFGNWNEKLQYSVVAEGNDAKPVTLWKKNPNPPGSEKYYGFTAFAFELNEILPGQEKILPRTDSRLRPDQRALEEGDIAQASSEKLRLEQKQREARKRLEEIGEHWSPRWFEKAVDPDSNAEYWKFKGGYWEEREKGQFKDIADIF